MQAKNHFSRNAVKIAVALVFLFFIASPVSAAFVGYVSEGSDGNYYEYNYDQLLDSYVLHILGSSAPLYDDYIKNTVKVFVDDVNGYIDYEDILDAYVLSIIEGRSFDVNQYTSSSEAKKAAMPAEVFLVSLDDKGELLYTPKTVDAVAEILAEVNGAATVEELEELITARSAQLGLNLADYGKLGRSSQTEVLNLSLIHI